MESNNKIFNFHSESGTPKKPEWCSAAAKASMPGRGTNMVGMATGAHPVTNANLSRASLNTSAEADASCGQNFSISQAQSQPGRMMVANRHSGSQQRKWDKDSCKKQKHVRPSKQAWYDKREAAKLQKAGGKAEGAPVIKIQGRVLAAIDGGGAERPAIPLESAMNKINEVWADVKLQDIEKDKIRNKDSRKIQKHVRPSKQAWYEKRREAAKLQSDGKTKGAPVEKRQERELAIIDCGSDDRSAIPLESAMSKVNEVWPDIKLEDIKKEEIPVQNIGGSTTVTAVSAGSSIQPPISNRLESLEKIEPFRLNHQQIVKKFEVDNNLFVDTKVTDYKNSLQYLKSLECRNANDLSIRERELQEKHITNIQLYLKHFQNANLTNSTGVSPNTHINEDLPNNNTGLSLKASTNEDFMIATDLSPSSNIIEDQSISVNQSNYLSSLFSPCHRQIKIVDRNHPEGRISPEKWLQIESIILEQIMKFTDKNNFYGFNGTKWQNGTKVIDCSNDKSADFIKLCISNMGELWTGAKLEVESVDTFSAEQILVNLFIPPPFKGFEFTKRLIELQNPHFQTTHWHVRNVVRVGNGRVLTISIDADTMQKLKASNGTIKFGLGHLRFSFFDEEESFDTTDISDGLQ